MKEEAIRKAYGQDISKLELASCSHSGTDIFPGEELSTAEDKSLYPAF